MTEQRIVINLIKYLPKKWKVRVIYLILRIHNHYAIECAWILQWLIDSLWPEGGIVYFAPRTHIVNKTLDTKTNQARREE